MVIYHLWPEALPGGFVGVDVFFAISGFLITSMLLREIDRDGTIRLSAFWARRARRLLPAALVTLLFCAVVTAIFVPLYYREGFLTDVRASTAYVQNWHLSAIKTDYFAAEGAPSPVQHYWSLSAEEQFYVIWPLILALALLATRRRALPLKRRSVGLAMGTLTVASLGWSLVQTAANPVAAYFGTPTRAWEFGVGGLLALAPEAHRSPAARAVLSWLGIAAIALAAFVYTDETPFPGWAALLPVVGGLAVIRAGARAASARRLRLMGLRPVQFTRRRLVLRLPLALAADHPRPVRARRGPQHRHKDRDPHAHPAHGVALQAVDRGSAPFGAVPGPAPSAMDARRPRLRDRRRARRHRRRPSARCKRRSRAAERASDRVLAERPACFGAASRDPGHPCDNSRLRLMVVPTPDRSGETSQRPVHVRIG